MEDKFAGLIKRVGDIWLSLCLILSFLPIFLIIGTIIFLNDGEPVFFVQKRLGLNGKIFLIYKFRTMKVNSELKGDGYYCFEGDKRITKTGVFLRKYSLDELPQLFNVIKGDMSFVGPRPAIYNEFDFEEINIMNKHLIHERTKVKPGITGYAQIKNRNDNNWNEKLILDSKYLSIKAFRRLQLDLLIIAITLLKIFSNKGVYDKKNNYVNK